MDVIESSDGGLSFAGPVSEVVSSRVGTKTLFSLFAKTKTLTKSVTVFAKFRLFFGKGFRLNFSRNVFAKTLI
jgi:hypothetical protein